MARYNQWLKQSSQAVCRRAQSLADLLEEAGMGTIFTRDLRRTIQTAEPLAMVLPVRMARIQRRDPNALLFRLRQGRREDVVPAAAQSETIPIELKSPGRPRPLKIGGADCGNLFPVLPVRPDADPPGVPRLRERPRRAPLARPPPSLRGAGALWPTSPRPVTPANAHTTKKGLDNA